MYIYGFFFLSLDCSWYPLLRLYVVVEIRLVRHAGNVQSSAGQFDLYEFQDEQTKRNVGIQTWFGKYTSHQVIIFSDSKNFLVVY